MAGSRAVSAREPGQIREEAALSDTAHAPRTSLAGAEDRRARPKARFDDGCTVRFCDRRWSAPMEEMGVWVRWRAVRRKHLLRRTPLRLLARAAALGSTAALLAVASAQAVPAQTISTDPYTTGGAQHATEVEPYAAASGNTIVSGFQVGRFNAGSGAMNIGWATSLNGGQTWSHGVLPSLT